MMKYKYKEDHDENKYSYKLPGAGAKSASHSNQLNKLLNGSCLNQKSSIIGTVLIVLLIWIINCVLYTDPKSKSADDYLCYGYLNKEAICRKLNNHEISGNLCMDLCITNTLDLPNCLNDIPFLSHSSYRYFAMPDLESTMIYAENNQINHRLNEGLSFDEFKHMIADFIMQRLNDSTTVSKIIDRIIFITDANSDRKLNYQEANTLWTLLNNKPTFYMLVLGERSYIPEIKSLCGGLVELEEIQKHLYQKQDYSLIKSVFTGSNYWKKIDIAARLKIALGILEFFTQAPAFNPNDEFGSNSLLLCSPVDISFGYTFFNDATLINYEELLSTSDALKKLNVPYCKTDADCVLTKSCSFQCDINKNKCTNKLVKPQLTSYCEFLEVFFDDNKNLSAEIKPLLAQCAQLMPYYGEQRVIYGKNEMPLTYSKVGDFVDRKEYWMNAERYSMMINDLESIMWERVRLVQDPKRPKKKTKQKKEEEEPPI